MKTEKLCQVVMLPTTGNCETYYNPEGVLPKSGNNWSFEGILKGIEEYHQNGEKNTLFGTLALMKKPYIGYVPRMWQPQHLYFISDDEIKKGDLVYVGGPHIPYVTLCTGIDETTLLDGCSKRIMISHCSKLVATTDSFLEELPSIPEEWIRTKYVPSNGSIKEVRLEQEWINLKRLNPPKEIDPRFLSSIDLPPIASGDLVLKLTPNNEVIIVDEPEDVLKGTDWEGWGKDQELEDAANNYIKDVIDVAGIHKGIAYTSFEAGAKWQKNRDNTEIERLKTIISTLNMRLTGKFEVPESCDFTSKCCQGERCMCCGEAATHKIEETVFDDDPCPNRHPLTGYLCDKHFEMVLMPYKDKRNIEQMAKDEWQKLYPNGYPSGWSERDAWEKWQTWLKAFQTAMKMNIPPRVNLIIQNVEAIAKASAGRPGYQNDYEHGKHTAANMILDDIKEILYGKQP